MEYSDDAVMGSFADLYEDREGNFWYLGLNIYSFNPYTQKSITIETKQLLNTLNNAIGNIQGTTPSGFAEMNDGRIYIGYYGSGIFSLDKYLLNPVEVKLPEYISKLIWTIFSNDGENLYFADQKKKFYQYNIRSKNVKTVINGNQFLRYTGACFIESDSIIWMAHHRDGITKFNSKKVWLPRYKNVSYPDKQLDENIYAIYPEGQNQLWLAS